MANTYTALYYHVVFSTKNRVAYIKPEIESRVWAYIGGVARAHNDDGIASGRCRRPHPCVGNGPSDALAEPDSAIPQRRLVEMDSRRVTRIARLRVARWVWGVHGK